MSWFRNVAASLVKYGSKALAGAVPFGEVLLEVGKDLWAKYRQQPEQGAPANLVADLQAVAAAPATVNQQAIAQAVQEVAADQPPEVQLALTGYLAQAPYAIRRSLRRPSDPSGTTVPATLAIQQPRDLIPLLPAALPRFKAGDRPLPGVPLVLEEMLGKGGFGEVWLARHPRDDTIARALKFCLDDAAANSLRHEAKALARVRREGKHAGIVELHQIWDENDPLCLEYEYVAGGDLSGLIRELHAAGPPKPDTVARWLLNLLDPIRFVHALTPPIVHRDLKPANILVERQKDGQFLLRVADFGISDVAARQALRDTASQSLMTVGVGGFTALYASPQQINNEPADPRDDIHALGVIWLQMLTGDLNRGRPSGSGWKIPLRARGMKEPMLELLEQCMDDELAVRPGDARELAGCLADVLETPSVIPTPKTDTPCLAATVKEIRKPEPPLTKVPGVPVVIPAPKLETPRVEAEFKEVKTPELPREIVNSIGMKLMFIPAGTFVMGSLDSEGSSDERPQHEVEITRPFYLSAYQVTQEEYQRIMRENPSYFCTSGKGKDQVQGIDTKRFPVEQVSWDEAVEFCQRLSDHQDENTFGLTYRLPTEAEWEYACCEGSVLSTPFHFGTSLSSMQANFDGNHPYGNVPKGPYLKRTCPVGSYSPNAFGLYDMHGNVAEWCSDWYDKKYYTQSPPQNPQGPQNGAYRIVRGGSWLNYGNGCRSAYRNRGSPNYRFLYLGFRIVCLSPGLR